MLAGISVDYVVRLEQGRGPHPSDQVIGALARALRLDQDERDHVFNLAGVAPPKPGTIEMFVRPSILRLIERFADLPTMVISAKSDILAWNAMSCALHGDWSALAPERRNQSRLRFLPDPAEPPHTPVGGTPEQRAATTRQTVASLRTAAGRYPDDPGLARLLSDLRRGSAEFRELWDVTEAGRVAQPHQDAAAPLAGRADSGVRHAARPGRRPAGGRLLRRPRDPRGRGARPAPRDRHPAPGRAARQPGRSR